MTEQQKIAAVIGVGAVAVLIYLMTRKATASNGSAVPDAVVTSGQPSYPNASPIDLGDIQVGGSPLNLTYNYGQPLPTLAIGDNTGGACGCDDSCEVAGQKVSVQTVSPDALRIAQSNFDSYSAKHFYAGTA